MGGRLASAGEAARLRETVERAVTRAVLG